MIVLWGHITPQPLQKVMSLLTSDPKLFEEGRLDTNHIDKLAGLGSNGVYSNHVWAQLENILPQPKPPKLQMIQLLMKHTTLGKEN